MSDVPSGPQGLSPYSGAMHVVVVDDERRMVELIASYLADHDIRTTAAHDGPSGLTAARQSDVDAVVLTSCCPA